MTCNCTGACLRGGGCRRRMNRPAERAVSGPEEVLVLPALFLLTTVLTVWALWVVGGALRLPLGAAAAVVVPPGVALTLSFVNAHRRSALQAALAGARLPTWGSRLVAVAALAAGPAMLFTSGIGTAEPLAAIAALPIVLALSFAHELAWHEHAGSRFFGSRLGVTSTSLALARCAATLPLFDGDTPFQGIGAIFLLPVFLVHATLFTALYQRTRSLALLACLDTFLAYFVFVYVLNTPHDAWASEHLLLVAAMAAVAAAVVSIAEIRRSAREKLDPSLFDERTRALGGPVIDATLMLVLAQPLALAIAGVLVLAFLALCFAGGKIPAQAPAILGVLVAFAGAAVLALVRSLRKGLRGRFRIVLFRSFTEPHASAVARVVAPVLAEFGHLTMLTDKSFEQYIPVKRSYHVMDPAQTRDGAGIRWSRDEDWKREVTALLAACDFIVIDISRPSSSITWEIEQARARLPESRILFIAATTGEGSEVGATYGSSRMRFFSQVFGRMRQVAGSTSGQTVAVDLQLRD